MMMIIIIIPKLKTVHSTYSSLILRILDDLCYAVSVQTL